jgi:MIP family channel proteins
MRGSMEPAPDTSTWSRRLVTEAFGTFALVFVAVGADAMASASGGQVSVAARAVAPALMVAGLIYAIGDGSGAHFNPVVSLAFALRRLFPASWLLPYWGAQLIGALAASLAVAVLLGSNLDAGVSRPHVAVGTALGLEVVLTLLLVSVILGTADRYRVVGHEAALAVGGTIALCGLIALPLEGASMNPARSLAPAIVAGDIGSVWIYICGPLLGAAVAVGLTRFLHGPTETDAKAREAAQGAQLETARTSVDRPTDAGRPISRPSPTRGSKGRPSASQRRRVA